MKFWQKSKKDESKNKNKKGAAEVAKEKIVPKKSEAKEEFKILKSKAKSGYANKILLRPLVTERTALLGGLRKYTFEIAPQTSKMEVAKAIYDLYGEKPVSVNILKVSGKKVRYGRTFGKRKNWKKAIVTFTPGIKLELYEGV